MRSTYAGEFRVDNLLGVPEKINIPERYVPEEQVFNILWWEFFRCVVNRPYDQVDERSPEERRTRLKKADSIRRMLAESQANQPIPSEWEKCQIIDNNWMKCVMSLFISAHFTEREGDQAGTVAEDRRQREQMLALSQVEADFPLLLCWKRIENDKRQL